MKQEKRIKIRIHGVSQNDQAHFKYAATLMGLKQGELFQRMLASFFETNPEIYDSLTNVTIKVKVVQEAEPVFEARNIEADRILRETRLLLSKDLTSKALAFRCDNMLRPFLNDRNTPTSQKKEIADFINSVSSGVPQ